MSWTRAGLSKKVARMETDRCHQGLKPLVWKRLAPRCELQHHEHSTRHSRRPAHPAGTAVAVAPRRAMARSAWIRRCGAWIPVQVHNADEMPCGLHCRGSGLQAAGRHCSCRSPRWTERPANPSGSTRLCQHRENASPAGRSAGRGWPNRGSARSVNTEAKYLMLRHAFEQLGCMRVELKTDSLNQRNRAMRCCGSAGKRGRDVSQSHRHVNGPHPAQRLVQRD